jgi:hypothetical protein
VWSGEEKRREEKRREEKKKEDRQECLSYGNVLRFLIRR